jgi:hypothetical protein
VVVVSVATIPLLIILEQPLVQFLKAPQLGQFFWLIPPTLLISGTFLALNYWNTRTKQFKRLSIARISSSFSTTGTQLGAGFLGYTSGGVLIYANVFGQFVSTSVLGIQIMRDHLSFFRETISWKGMADTFRRVNQSNLLAGPGSFVILVLFNNDCRVLFPWHDDGNTADEPDWRCDCTGFLSTGGNRTARGVSFPYF